MKKLKLFIPLLIIIMVMPACQKENTFEDQVTLNKQVILDDQVAEARNPNPRPFHATIISTFLAPPQPNPGICGTGFPILHLGQSLTGNATHMGKISGTISACADVSTNPPTFTYGLATFVAANGDTLYILGFEEPYQITGGSGRFEDATGALTSTFMMLEPGVFEEIFDGEIYY